MRLLKGRVLPKLGPLVGLFLFLAALWVLHRELREFHITEITQTLHGLPKDALAVALLLTVLNYFVLTGYDWLALKYIQKRIEYRRISIVSFVSYAFSNGLGFATIAGSSVRFRLYSSWGLDAIDIGKIVSFCILTLWLGLFTTGGFCFLTQSDIFSARGVLSPSTTRMGGVFLLCLVGGYLSICVFRKKPYSFRAWEFALPSPAQSVGQIALSCVDWALAAAVLYVLLPTGSEVTYGQFLAVFLLAQMAGILSQIPAGLGVLESVVITFLSPVMPAHTIIAGLVAYRAIYYLLPLSVAAGLLGFREVLDRRSQVQRLMLQILSRWLPGVLPRFLVAMTFLGGCALLASGVTPAIQPRLAWLRLIVPLPLLEVSHFLSTLIGAALLVLSRGLQRRINAAWYTTVILLLAGVVFSLLKGFDYEEALFLSVTTVLLGLTRKHFYRTASVFSDRLSPGWVAAISAMLFGSAWLGFFSYKHMEYTNDFLWQFEFNSDAPRFLRAMAGTAAGLVIFGIIQLFKPAKPEPALPDRDGLDKARPVIAAARNTSAYLALLGDKRLLFSDSGETFIMYAVEGRSWIALGDPVGSGEETGELLWCFREICDRHGGWPVFYEVGAENLPVYLDLGLTPMKIGEEARVDLSRFSLDGGSRKALRQISHRIEREGGTFSVVPLAHVPPLVPELRIVSDEWLERKHTREKGFSLGFFNDDYICRTDVAVVYDPSGRIRAFANLWKNISKEELSIDLMRYDPKSPSGIMEYLFVELMLWGKTENYEWFSLGMAPLAGLERHPLAPLWHKIGTAIFDLGDEFYNFEGLYEYKAKFEPEWQPRYLAAPAGLSTPFILMTVTRLISGSWKGIFYR